MLRCKLRQLISGKSGYQPEELPLMNGIVNKEDTTSIKGVSMKSKNISGKSILDIQGKYHTNQNILAPI